MLDQLRPDALRPSTDLSRTWLVAVVVFLVDQLSKAVVRGTLAPCSATSCAQIHACPLLFVNQTNPGGAFSLGPGSALWVGLTLTSVLLVPVYGARIGRT